VAHLDLEERETFRGALVMDMIGYSSDTRMDVQLEYTSAFADFGGFVAATGDAFTDLTILPSTAGGASDHAPFLSNDMPATLSITRDYSHYPYYHLSTDTPDKMTTPDQLAEIVRLNLAACARLANPDVLVGEHWVLF